MHIQYKANPATLVVLVLVIVISALILSACGNDTNGQSTAASMTVESNLAAGGIKAAPTPPASDTAAPQPTPAAQTSAAAGGTAAAPAGGSSTGDAQAGLKLFQTNGCSGCHLQDGKGTGGVGPQLSNDPKITGADFIHNQVRNAAPPMPKFGTGQISDSQLNDLTAYILSIHK